MNLINLMRDIANDMQWQILQNISKCAVIWEIFFFVIFRLEFSSYFILHYYFGFKEKKEFPLYF